MAGYWELRVTGGKDDDAVILLEMVEKWQDANGCVLQDSKEDKAWQAMEKLHTALKRRLSNDNKIVLQGN